MQILSSDIRDLVQLLTEHDVDFGICGGHAVAFHGYPRLTVDLDILILPNPENAKRVMAALTAFGFGNAGIPEQAFANEGTVVSLGAQPNQVDLLTCMSNTPTRDVIKRAQPGLLADVPVRFVSLPDLLEAKRQAGRTKDLADIEELSKRIPET